MDTVKSNTDNVQEKTDTGRRSFLWKVGAGMSAVLVATVPAVAEPLISTDKKLKTSVDSLSRQVAALENEKSIHELHKTYEDMLDNGRYSDVLNIFTNDAEVIFNGGVFKGKHGLKRLFCEYFRSGMTGKRIDQAPGFQLKPEQQQDMVEISPDQKSAKAAFTYSIQVGVPIDSDSLLVKMSRLHGEGIMRWWEGGIYDLSYVKNIKDGSWKVKRLEYRTISKADYRPGKSSVMPINVQCFSKVYPADPTGPDRLVS
jgi:hypothetical protein